MAMTRLLAVLVAFIVGYLIPMLWYSKSLFGTSWLKLSGQKSMKPSGSVILVGFIVTVIFNAVLALLITLTGATALEEGIGLAFLLWIGFIFTSKMDSVLYEKKSIKLYWIVTIQYLLSMIAGGIILTLWQ